MKRLREIRVKFLEQVHDHHGELQSLRPFWLRVRECQGRRWCFYRPGRYQFNLSVSRFNVWRIRRRRKSHRCRLAVGKRHDPRTGSWSNTRSPVAKAKRFPSRVVASWSLLRSWKCLIPCAFTQKRDSYCSEEVFVLEIVCINQRNMTFVEDIQREVITYCLWNRVFAEYQPVSFKDEPRRFPVCGKDSLLAGMQRFACQGVYTPFGAKRLTQNSHSRAIVVSTAL